MKGYTFKRCSCKHPETGREIGRKCPDLTKKGHGTYGYSIKVETTGRVRELRRIGFPTLGKADGALDHVRDLIRLAGPDDRKTRQKIGDLIVERTRRGGEMPAVDDVRRRLGLGRDPGQAGETFSEAWHAWLAGKRKLRASSTKRYEEIGRHWLLPVLADIQVDKLTGEHCAAVFQRVEMFNEEIEAAADDGRAPDLPGDVRSRPHLVGVATQHRIFAALRVFLNHCWKKRHVIAFNPIYAVELEPETRDDPLVWEPAQVARFLAVHADDRLHALWRLVLLRGFRRGELAGLADDAVDLDEGTVRVSVALVQVGGRLVWGPPKSRAGGRVVDLDEESVAVCRAHRARRARERLAAGEAWVESGRFFCREDGAPLNPEWISRRFKAMAETAGLPVMKLHGARHTAASLMLEAGLDVKVVQDTLGHSTSVITRDTYQHVRRQVHKDAAQKVVDLLGGQKDAKDARS
jgi:integrase